MTSPYAPEPVARSSLAIGLFQRPFCFLRHGQTQTNVLDLIAGWGDTELTDPGRQQAQAAAGMLAHEPITAIYSGLPEAADSVHNAMPVQFVPSPHGWKVDTIPTT